MSYTRKPDWLKIKILSGKNSSVVEEVVERYGLHTVCREAACPNRMECFSKRTTTFMILGDTCTRSCRFCNVTPGRPDPPDPAEPGNIARAVRELSLRHVVITSVTRDDLPDGGASHFVETVGLTRTSVPGIIIEVLIPDFQGDPGALEAVIRGNPDIINHNVETVPRLYSLVRPQAVYNRSLELLKRVSGVKKIFTKSGIMVGFGETEQEVRGVLRDLKKNGCDIITIGQYLEPSREHFRVKEYISPEIFKKYKKYALSLGFKSVAAGPFVRSSYNAEEFFRQYINAPEK